jgi:hypothetical protein
VRLKTGYNVMIDSLICFGKSTTNTSVHPSCVANQKRSGSNSNQTHQTYSWHQRLGAVAFSSPTSSPHSNLPSNLTMDPYSPEGGTVYSTSAPRANSHHQQSSSTFTRPSTPAPSNKSSTSTPHLSPRATRYLSAYSNSAPRSP